MPIQKCLVNNCKRAIAIHSERKFMVRHYIWKHTRSEIIELAKQYGISNNPYFETTWILAYKLAEKSEVITQ